MSEAKSSKKRSKAKTESAPKAESAPKTESAPKAEAKSESADATPTAKDDAASTPPESSSTDTTSSDGAKDAGTDAAKSAREAVGGKSEVHYGYFSSVRTPEYRSGWDSIWGNRNGTNGEERRRGAPAAPGGARRPAGKGAQAPGAHHRHPRPRRAPALAQGRPGRDRACRAQEVPRELRTPRQGRRHRLAHHLPRGLRAQPEIAGLTVRGGPGRKARSARPRVARPRARAHHAPTMPLPNVVMPGLVPGIHLFQPGPLERCANTWMAGTSPAMTCGGRVRRRGRAGDIRCQRGHVGSSVGRRPTGG